MISFPPGADATAGIIRHVDDGRSLADISASPKSIHGSSRRVAAEVTGEFRSRGSQRSSRERFYSATPSDPGTAGSTPSDHASTSDRGFGSRVERVVQPLLDEGFGDTRAARVGDHEEVVHDRDA